MAHSVVFVVTHHDQEERAIALVEDAGATGVTAPSARGVGSHARRTIFDGEDAHGICFSVPVDQVSLPGHFETL